MKYAHLALFLCVLFLLPVFASASESSGTIQFENKNALVCHSVDCTVPTPGVINFAPTGATPVTITDANGIDGIAWGNEIGWINFDPTGPEGVTINPTTGVLSGKAWSQVSGWINFSVTGQSVAINSSGEFFGYAWTGGPYGGWIRFDCAFAGACVKTDWRPVSARVSATSPTPTVSSNNVSISPGSSVPIKNGVEVEVVDACPNVIGQQDQVPANYSKDSGGLCLIKIDYCKNIEGNQLVVPAQYVLSGSGQCIMLTEENKEEYIYVSNTDSAEKPPKDFCSNLFGLQNRVPDGFYESEGICQPIELDYCPNILGNQYTLPKDMKVSNAGGCVQMTKAEISAYDMQPRLTGGESIEMLGYGFVPRSVKTPLVFPFANTSLTIGDREVDVWSFLISLVIIFPLFFVLFRRIKMLINF